MNEKRTDSVSPRACIPQTLFCKYPWYILLGSLMPSPVGDNKSAIFFGLIVLKGIAVEVFEQRVHQRHHAQLAERIFQGMI